MERGGSLVAVVGRSASPTSGENTRSLDVTEKGRPVDVFAKAYRDDSWDALLDMIEARTGKRPSAAWAASVAGEAMAHIRRYAPCRRDEWLTPADLPPDTATVLLSVMVRTLDNPTGIRTEQAGEYSITYAGQVPTTGAPLTVEEAAIIKADAKCGRGQGNSVPIAGLPTIPQRLPDRMIGRRFEHDAGLGL